MAQCYNKRHAVHILAVGDMLSIGIPGEDRAKTNNKQKLLRNYSQLRVHNYPEKHGDLVLKTRKRACSYI